MNPPVLKLSGIEKTYGTEQNPVPVLRGIDFELHKSEYLAIVGPSGSGKSTLLNILGCLDQPTLGSYAFLGENVDTFDDLQLSRIRNQRIGFVFQSFQLVSHLSVLENVELPLFYSRVRRRERHRRCGELIRRVGLGHRETHLPSELSGGECQRAAIARALSNNPDLLLADEPTGNLDSATSQEILGLFHELNESGVTIVMITHDRTIARAIPRTISIRDGRIERDAELEASKN